MSKREQCFDSQASYGIFEKRPQSSRLLAFCHGSVVGLPCFTPLTTGAGSVSRMHTELPARRRQEEDTNAVGPGQRLRSLPTAFEPRHVALHPCLHRAVCWGLDKTAKSMLQDHTTGPCPCPLGFASVSDTLGQPVTCPFLPFTASFS